MQRASTATAIVAAVGLASAVSAQELIFDLSDIPAGGLLFGDTATIRLSAGFDPSDYAVAGVRTDFISSVGSEGFSNPRLVAPMDGPGTSAGVLSATGVDTIISGQLNFPTAGIYADPTNPIAFWEIDYTVDTFDVFEVDLRTATSRFDVYFARDSAISEPQVADLTEASGSFLVNVPAPGTLGLLALGGLALRRRR
ncbi:MAG: PEP-CTERM sorting domain-containing protein [Planctomycetota bacterium]